MFSSLPSFPPRRKTPLILLPLLAWALTPSTQAEEISATNRLDQVLESHVLRVGMTGDYPPFSRKQGEEAPFEGLDVDLAEDLAKSLGARLELVPTTWARLGEDLDANRFDIAMGGVSVTLERQRRGYFSLPYLKDGKTPITRCENQKRYQTLEQIDRPEVRVLVNPGGTNERFARSRLKIAELRIFPDNRRIFDEIIQGRGDLMITDAIETRLQARLHPELCAVHPDMPFDFSEKAYLLPRDGTWKAYVDQWLHQWLASGRFQQRLEHWLAYPWQGGRPTPPAATATAGSPAPTATPPSTVDIPPLSARAKALPEPVPVAAGLPGLLQLMDQRLALAPEVARAKWNRRGTPAGAIEDPVRELAIIADIRERARTAGLPEDWAVAFFRAQIEAGKDIQRRLFARWEGSRQGDFADAADLARDLRPRFDALSVSLLAALRASWPELGSGPRPAATQLAQKLTIQSRHPEAALLSVTPLLMAPSLPEDFSPSTNDGTREQATPQ